MHTRTHNLQPPKSQNAAPEPSDQWQCPHLPSKMATQVAVGENGGLALILQHWLPLWCAVSGTF